MKKLEASSKVAARCETESAVIRELLQPSAFLLSQVSIARLPCCRKKNAKQIETYRNIQLACVSLQFVCVCSFYLHYPDILSTLETWQIRGHRLDTVKVAPMLLWYTSWIFHRLIGSTVYIYIYICPYPSITPPNTPTNQTPYRQVFGATLRR